MQRRNLIILVVLAVVCLASAQSGWTPVNPADPYVREIAEYAVTDHNKKFHVNLQFLDVVKGDKEDFEGTVFHLILHAKDGETARSYRAIVWDKPQQHTRYIVSFIQLDG